MDVKTTFLHGDFNEEQLEGFVQNGKEHLMCKLKKNLYGLKQAPRRWYHKFNTFMQSQGYKRSTEDPCLHVKRQESRQLVILTRYVDDMLIASHSKKDIVDLKMKLKSQFDMKDLGNANLILEGAAAQPIPILPLPSLPDPPASPVITPSTSHPVSPIQSPDVSPDHALSDSDSDLDVADATPEVDLAPPRQEKRIPGWLYSTVASSGVTELPVPPPAGLPRRSARLQKRGQPRRPNVQQPLHAENGAENQPIGAENQPQEVAIDAPQVGEQVEDEVFARTLCLLPAKFNKTLWIRKGSFVVVEEGDREGALESGNKVTGVICQVLFGEQIRALKRSLTWPAAFEDSKMMRDSESEGINSKDSTVKASTSGGSCSEDDDDLPPLESNQNRRPMDFDFEESSSDEED
ncbi:hypothetical protein L7F22_017275 [Adiantum nelumboides]|nr:hypothetical protein [Adiantum nelumboides]